jgi:hypothetical protein
MGYFLADSIWRAGDSVGHACLRGVRLRIAPGTGPAVAIHRGEFPVKLDMFGKRRARLPRYASSSPHPSFTKVLNPPHRWEKHASNRPYLTVSATHPLSSGTWRDLHLPGTLPGRATPSGVVTGQPGPAPRRRRHLPATPGWA